MAPLALLLALTAGQIPTPVKLVEARRVFLAAEGVQRALLEELGQQLKEWGRWRLESDEATSDLVVLLTRSAAAEPDGAAWVITIREPSRPTPLYSDTQTGSYAAGAVTQLVGRLKAVVEGTGSPAPSMPAPSTAGPSAPAPPVAGAEPVVSPTAAGEPCRVFVTEQMVNPSLYTVVKRIKYAKKYYGGSSHAWAGMAREGWKVDADAVVAVNINFTPSGFSWASPHAEGIAVKWNDEGRRQFRLLAGQCFARPEK
jgi:hypothetical protein